MPPHFTGLPREIRDAILELCLVVKGPINPYPTNYEDRNPFEKTERKPDVALLEVNRNINVEASRIFYGGNLWKHNWRSEDYSKLPETAEFEDIIKHLKSLPRVKIWFTHRAQIRHITLDLDVRDQNATVLLHHTECEYERIPSEASSAKRVEAIHQSRDMFLTFSCAFKLCIIRNMQLKSARINGCCRLGLVRDACFHHLQLWASSMKLEPGHRPAMPNITVVGFRNEDELTAGRGWWEESHGVQLDYVTDMNGQRIGLRGFHETDNAKSDCS